MQAEKWFPVLKSHDQRRVSDGCPDAVPWEFLAPHERQALRNHSQTLRQLAARGGLSPAEMVFVVEGRDWQEMRHSDAVARLRELLAARGVRMASAGPVNVDGNGAPA